MITDFILNAVYGVASTLLDAIPTVGIEWGSVNWSMLGFANAFMPLSEVMAFLRVMVAATTAALGLWLVKKVIDWLPFT